MTVPCIVTAAAVADAAGIRGSCGLRATWSERDQDPVAGRIGFRPVFDRPFRDFRRLDILSRMFVLATEACGLDAHLSDEQREATALVLATSTGCLAADVRFELGLRTPVGIQPALFPYTLPSTCLGEVAIRHGLRGPTLCLSVEAGAEHEALTAASRLLATAEARAALVLLGDWVPRPIVAALPPEARSRADKTAVAALLLQPGDADTPDLPDHLANLEEVGRPAIAAVDAILARTSWMV